MKCLTYRVTRAAAAAAAVALGRPSKASFTPGSSPSFGPVTSPILGIWVTCLRRVPEHCRKIERREGRRRRRRRRRKGFPVSNKG
ncbi:hypothetical protein M0804_015204 [Polistes exclamans]|nr:hypothetical protein M0804_015205 [Polistes exclamans]KAI4473738.1 hypothetical protein M0804_015204 [Polistes exclamans]